MAANPIRNNALASIFASDSDWRDSREVTSLFRSSSVSFCSSSSAGVIVMPRA
ncbi:hypothetical protein [Streptomyces zaomyceticus]|uniref:hypothetical protein n=1 Tax=Streptomyces zaomyceticus TaxID=68286 RepID=UPI0036CBA011